MIVYVESNFVLELAFLQEQYESCDAIFGLGETKQVELVLPAFSLGELFDTLHRRSARRSNLRQQLAFEIHQLSRSNPYRDSAKELGILNDLLTESADAERQRLHQVLRRILSCAETIPISSEIIEVASSYQSTSDISPQDSIVYASVVSHLSASRPEPKCLLNRDARGFYIPYIREQLARYNCRLIPNFEDGLNYIRHQRR